MVRESWGPLALLAAVGLALLPGLATADETVGVDLAEFSVTAGADTVEAGAITFEINNAGAFPHEFVVIRTDLAPDALPATDGEADEAQLDVVGKVDPFASGESQTLTVDLTAGSYALICNVKGDGFPGHYGNGMFTAFTVTEAAAAGDDTASDDDSDDGTTAPVPPDAGNAGLLGAGGASSSALAIASLALVAMAAVAGGRLWTARSRG